jgi:hypothetical protein
MRSPVGGNLVCVEICEQGDATDGFPLRLEDYRRGVRALLALEASPLRRAGRSVTEAESSAFMPVNAWSWTRSRSPSPTPDGPNYAAHFLVGYAAASVIEPEEAPIEAMYRAIANGANITLRDRVTARWRELEDILGAGLHHDPAHRPTAAEFANMAPAQARSPGSDASVTGR